MGVVHDFLHRPDADLLIDQYRNSVANRRQRVKVVRNHEDRYPKASLQASDQIIECSRADRVQPGRRFVQEHDLRIQR